MTRPDLISSEPGHSRAGERCFALQLDPLKHKLLPIVSRRRRRVTFIVTSGGRFTQAL